jgi:acetolactate synthase-1/2/3 large subunit
MGYLDGGEMVARVLKKEGIKAIFTLCGGHILPVYEGCRKEGIAVIDVRHEQAAAHAADAYARITRGIGVCVVTAGPGVTDAVTGIANAFFAKSPVVCIGGAAPFSTLGKGNLQEMDQVSLMRPITKWAEAVYDTKRIPEFLMTAIRQALSPKKGPVYLEVPMDTVFGREDEGAIAWPKSFRSPFRMGPEPKAIEELAALFGQAKRPVVIAGSDLYLDKAWEALRVLAETQRVPVFLNGMARGALPSEHPNFFQYTRRKACQGADLSVVIGTPLDFRLDFGSTGLFPEHLKLAMLGDPDILGKNRELALGVPGDIRLALEGLLESLPQVDNEPDRMRWIEQLRKDEETKATAEEEKAKIASSPMSSYRFLKELREALTEDDILIGDGGDIVALGSKLIPAKKPGHWMDPGPMGCLGVGAPFAIAAKLLHPQKNIVILYGDGSFGLNGFEFDTAVRFKLPIIGVIGNDAAWSQIRNPQLDLYGEEASIGTALAATHYEEVVKGLGGYGEYVDDPAAFRGAFERAKASNKPALLNVRIDPKVGKEQMGVRGGAIY